MKKLFFEFSQNVVIALSVATFSVYLAYSPAVGGPTWISIVLAGCGQVAGLFILWSGIHLNDEIKVTRKDYPQWARIFFVGIMVAASFAALYIAMDTTKQIQINSACDRVKQRSATEVFASARCRAYFSEQYRADRNILRTGNPR